MLSRRLAQLSLKRALHTSIPRPRPSQARLALAFGATAVTGTYFAFRLNSPHNVLALDSHSPTPPKAPTPPPLHVEPEADESQKLKPEPSEVLPESESQTDSSDGGGAYNPVTGEINWDCPCLGGMAHGPCGPEFREAFSCFIYSEDEPKGINCVEKFKGMQDCFRAHPEIYADEIDDDDKEDASVAVESTEILPPSSDDEASSPPSRTEEKSRAQSPLKAEAAAPLHPQAPTSSH